MQMVLVCRCAVQVCRCRAQVQVQRCRCSKVQWSVVMRCAKVLRC